MNAMNRRRALSTIGAAAALPTLAAITRAAESAGIKAQRIATNTYPWFTFARRAEIELQLHADPLLSQIASAGIGGYEPIIKSPKEFDGLGNRLRESGLEMRPLYVNSTLHDPAKAEASIAGILAIAKRAKELGVRIIVTNPSPIRWGGTENKSDPQLRLQAKSLDRLGYELRQLGLTLAYHNHDAELRAGGREFHHMLTATDPANVKFCLDAHWVYRGCGDSQVALFDAVAHYHDRIVELHLRQSQGGIWSEAFSMRGDIDYERLFRVLAAGGQHPYLVLEQAIEKGSPNQLSAVEAHRRGREILETAIQG